MGVYLKLSKISRRKYAALVNKDNQPANGFTLIEVLVGLAVLALVVGSFLPMLANSEIWIMWAGDETVATNYANSIVETIKAHSIELEQVSEHYNTDSDGNGVNDIYQCSDSDDATTFSFTLDPDASFLVVEKPDNMSATISISQYDDTAPYVPDNPDDEIILYLSENLFNVDVQVEVTRGEKVTSYTLCTVIGAE